MFVRDFVMYRLSSFNQIPKIVVLSKTSLRISSPIWQDDCILHFTHQIFHLIFKQTTRQFVKPSKSMFQPSMDQQCPHLNSPQIEVIVFRELLDVKLCSCHFNLPFIPICYERSNNNSENSSKSVEKDWELIKTNTNKYTLDT